MHTYYTLTYFIWYFSSDATVYCIIHFIYLNLSVPDNCTEGEVRLVSGASEREGTVQICANDVWGTVCDSSWGSPEAKVVCKQLGFFSFGKLVFYPFESAVHF